MAAEPEGLLVDTHLLLWWALFGRSDYKVNPLALGMGLLQEGFRELPVQVEHVLAVLHLAWIHRDPFDRLLVTQAAQERLGLLTAYRILVVYGETVRWAG